MKGTFRHTVSCYFPTPRVNDKEILNILAHSYELESEPPCLNPLVFYDTFDWRLFIRDVLLFRTGGGYQVTDLNMESVRHALELPSAREYRFWWEFPESPLRDYLEKLIGPRALLERGDMVLESHTYRLLDDNRKTVSRASFETIKLKRGDGQRKTGTMLILSPLRGYAKDLETAAGLLAGYGIVPAAEPYGAALLSMNGAVAGDYSSDLRFALSPGMLTVDAVSRILLKLTAAVRKNEKGILEDIDVEFLHDYRVAVRKARSLIGQVKGVFPADALNTMKTALKSLARDSSVVRDLDVILVMQDELRSLLPLTLAGNLGHFFASVRKRRQAAWEKLVQFITSQEYRDLLSGLEKLLRRSGPAPECAYAARPILETAGRTIWKSYRKVHADRRIISDGIAPEQIHQLRIKCKKLRYLLEFFRSLYDEESIGTLVKLLKDLQSYLGSCNDYSQQILLLQQYLDGLSSEDKSSIRDASATGGLLSRIHQQRESLMGEIGGPFERFCSPEVKADFSRLFRRL